ncbi:family 43 glycosylhydrolase [Sphingobacterium bovistauri]|nr:family 43 glycosylhydrolase [Sphingobacterium bovistauri]
MNRIVFLFLLFLVTNSALSQTVSSSGFLNIKNDVFWDTQDGQPIYSQGGGIFRFVDPVDGVEKYFWYGAKYEESAIYRNNPTITPAKDNFLAVTCYVSSDLVNWSARGDVLTKDHIDAHSNTSPTRWAGRLGVAHVKEINKYALIIQHNDQVLITVAEKPDGPFVWHQRINMQSTIGTSNTGDQTVFTDEDTGKSYLVYSYGRGRNRIYVSEIGMKDGKVGLLDCVEIFKGAGREGNCMFKYKGKYYLFASNLYGWDSSFAYYLVADDVRGPFRPTNEMLVLPGSEEDYAHVTQTGFFINVKGTNQETVIYCGDRWANFAGNGLGYNQWCPLSFDGDKPYFNSLSSWGLNPTTGEWIVAKDNDFVKNGSFEADRRYIPSPVKPVQEQLLGWNTEIIEGNKLSVGDSLSPVLNYFNKQEDRKIVVGEKSLHINDAVDFKRKISQNITSTTYVKLEDGLYTLKAMYRNNGKFRNLEMFASSSGKILKYPFKKTDSIWKTATLDNIRVKNGQVEIGFLADGKSGAQCLIDDISLVRKK